MRVTLTSTSCLNRGRRCAIRHPMPHLMHDNCQKIVTDETRINGDEHQRLGYDNVHATILVTASNTVEADLRQKMHRITEAANVQQAAMMTTRNTKRSRVDRKVAGLCTNSSWRCQWWSLSLIARSPIRENLFHFSMHPR